MAGSRVHDILGQVNNPVRREMEEIAVKSGLKFIVNVVLNCDGGVVAVVAGDVVSAHRAGVEIARPIYTVELDERPDIVIASSHPADRDLWQGIKPVNSCGMMVKDGGTLILLIPAPEGIAPDHPSFVDFGLMSTEEVYQIVERSSADPRTVIDGVAASTYMALDQTRRRVHVALVTDGITEKEASQIGLTVTCDFNGALAAALARHGGEARIGVVTHGADVIGRFI
jgi:nickel-dependent lactate racemase